MSEAAHDPSGKALDPAPTNPSKIIRAYRSVPAWALFLIPAALGVSADLTLKAWSFPNGPVGRAPFTIVPNVLNFVTTTNQGMVFGIGQGNVPLFAAFSWVALAIILWVFATSDAKHRLVHLALGLITAGAIGNLYDRVFYRGVRDMLKFDVTWYPYIFNLADVLLCIGVPLLIARWLFVQDTPPTETKTLAP